MRRSPDPARTGAPAYEPDVVPATGVYRVVIILLAVWTIFAGLALATQGVPAISLGGDNAAERMLGAQMLVFVPIYGLIIWRPDEHRHLRWVPYAAQLAVVVPFLWDALITTDHDFFDGTLLFIGSAVFLGVLIYVRTSAHPLGFFSVGEEEDVEEEETEEPPDDGEDEEPEDDPGAGAGDARQQRGRRYRRN